MWLETRYSDMFVPCLFFLLVHRPDSTLLHLCDTQLILIFLSSLTFQQKVRAPPWLAATLFLVLLIKHSCHITFRQWIWCELPIPSGSCHSWRWPAPFWTSERLFFALSLLTSWTSLCTQQCLRFNFSSEHQNSMKAEQFSLLEAQKVVLCNVYTQNCVVYVNLWPSWSEMNLYWKTKIINILSGIFIFKMNQYYYSWFFCTWLKERKTVKSKMR